MSEIRLTSTAPTPPITATPGATPAASAQTLTAVAPPPPPDAPAVSLGGTLATLSEGDQLEGVVIGEDAAGVPILRTANGSYLLTSAQPIAQNTYLVLQIVGTGGTIQALILSENGVAQQPPLKVQLTLLGPDAESLLELPALEEATATSTENPTARRWLGTVLPDQLTGRPGHARTLPAGSTLVLQLADASESGAPSSQSSAAQPASANVSPIEGATSAKTNVPGGLPPSTDNLSSDTVSSTISLLAPVQPAPQPIGNIASMALVGSRISGLAVATATAGQVLIRTPLGLLSVETKTPLAAGAGLSFEVVSIKLPAKAPASGGDAFGNPLSRLSHEWPALREALSALQVAAPEEAPIVIESAIPALSEKLTSGLLFFFSALRGGTVSAWLGNGTLDRLDRAGRRDLLHRLTEDFADLSRLGRQNGQSDWHAVPLPLYDGHRVVQVMLFARHHRREDEAGESKDLGTRFILDLDFAVTGPIQLDGLVQAHQFDLIVRSHTALPTDIRYGISTTFDDCLSTARRRGTLNFQVSSRFPPMPAQELRTVARPTAIVV